MLRDVIPKPINPKKAHEIIRAYSVESFKNFRNSQSSNFTLKSKSPRYIKTNETGIRAEKVVYAKNSSRDKIVYAKNSSRDKLYKNDLKVRKVSSGKRIEPNQIRYSVNQNNLVYRNDLNPVRVIKEPRSMGGSSFINYKTTKGSRIEIQKENGAKNYSDKLENVFKAIQRGMSKRLELDNEYEGKIEEILANTIRKTEDSLKERGVLPMTYNVS